MVQEDIHTWFTVEDIISTPRSEVQPTVQNEPYIHILSSDVLIEIFSILFDEKKRDNDEFETPLQYWLSTVCRQWRELINNMPLFWNVINISSKSPFDPTLFFKRSNPVLIDVCYTIHPSTDWIPDDTHATRISQAISANFSRIRTLVVCASDATEIYQTFRMMKKPKPVNLTTLQIATKVGFFVSNFSCPFPIKTSNVKHLELTKFPFQGFSTLTNLTSLTLDKLKTDVQTFQALFDNSPSLETLVIRHFGTTQVAVADDTQVDTPSLRHLVINIDNNHAKNCKCFFPFLFAPNLEKLEITYCWFAFNSHHEAMLGHLKEFPNLQKLRIRSLSIWLENVSFLSSLPPTTDLEVIGFPRAMPAFPALFYILNLSDVRSITIDLNFHRKSTISMNLQIFFDIIRDHFKPMLRCPVSVRSHFHEESLSGHPARAILGDLFTLLRASAGKGVLDDYIDRQTYNTGPLLWEEESDSEDDDDCADDMSFDHQDKGNDPDDFEDRIWDNGGDDNDNFDKYNNEQDKFSDRTWDNGDGDDNLEYNDEQDEFEDLYAKYVNDEMVDST